MNKIFYIISTLLLILLFAACSKEQERKFVSSSDMLIGVRLSEVFIDIETTDAATKLAVEKAIEALLVPDSIRFVRGYEFEMLLNGDKTLHIYESGNDYDKGRIKATGNYSFASDAMEVSFSLGDKDRSFGISGHGGNIFYNHFIRNSGTGEPHIVAAHKVFCLHDCYTEAMQEKFPSMKVNKVEIKTDMITMRSLETFK